MEKAIRFRVQVLQCKEQFRWCNFRFFGKLFIQQFRYRVANANGSSVGYRPIEITLQITGKTIHMDLSLKEEPNELKAVTISAGSFAAGDKTRGAVMSSLDIATTAGSNADITAALKTLPGTQQVGEQEGLFVRGGTGAGNKTIHRWQPGK